jgi:hypothetical protein
MALAEFVHEQLHWFEETHADARDDAIEETKQLYPVVPIARPDGAGSEVSIRDERLFGPDRLPSFGCGEPAPGR